MENDPITRLLAASIPHELNKKKLSQMRSELNIQEDLALQIVDLRRDIRSLRSTMNEARFTLYNAKDQLIHLESFSGRSRLDSTVDALRYIERTISEINSLLNKKQEREEGN